MISNNQIDSWAREIGNVVTDKRQRVNFEFDIYGLVKLCNLVAATQTAQAEPVNDGDVLAMCGASEWRGSGGQANWFCEGVRAAEKHHGIGAGTAT